MLTAHLPWVPPIVRVDPWRPGERRRASLRAQLARALRLVRTIERSIDWSGSSADRLAEQMDALRALLVDLRAAA